MTNATKTYEDGLREAAEIAASEEVPPAGEMPQGIKDRLVAGDVEFVIRGTVQATIESIVERIQAKMQKIDGGAWGWKIDGERIEILGVDADRTSDEELAHYPWTAFHGLPKWAARKLAARVKAYRAARK